eukprot:Gb_20827 [translate_table: standard]
MAKAETSMQWMEIAPPRMVCTARRPLKKTLEPIAEECSLTNEEVMEGLQFALKMACDLQAEAKNDIYAHQGL